MTFIRIVYVKNSFSENVQENYLISKPEELANDILQEYLQGKNETSRFEIIKNDCSIYFDIEQIPENDPGKIYDILGNIIKME